MPQPGAQELEAAGVVCAGRGRTAAPVVEVAVQDLMAMQDPSHGCPRSNGSAGSIPWHCDSLYSINLVRSSPWAVLLEDGVEDGVRDRARDGVEDGPQDGVWDGAEDGAQDGLLLSPAPHPPHGIERIEVAF
ncbi:hypothetical protein AV530_003716 [Patagioenas fasciata monilis]|uniref:Uncharacterized protein n=1 Tax=Patagioenas fasciata monilis TaxID=372326 RepID=A0A1V4KYL1_PATFA|nr:hypothetical protein AV530_003716 [Patagioenas fasciata monilis]